MNSPHSPDARANQYDRQVNQASDGASIYTTQNGGQSISNTYHTVHKGHRVRTGWAVLVVLVLDVVYFFYGMAAYTGRPGDPGDLWRAGIAILLLATTGSLIRRWFRLRL